MKTIVLFCLVCCALAQQVHRETHVETSSNVQTNASKVDFDRLNSELDQAANQGEEGYRKFLDMIAKQREDLQHQYDQLAGAAQDQVRGSLDRAQAWKENARKEAQESIRKLQEFQAKAQQRNQEFIRMGRLSNPAHHKLKCTDIQGEKGNQYGVTEADRKIICEEVHNNGAGIVGNLLLFVLALAVRQFA
ncbi:hypothetical protein HDE_13038 [Halotydeus destructor]|nr:hypothetical protein HDE_13038 [Halotydeus destructor]